MSNAGLGDLTPEEIQMLMTLIGQQGPGAFGGDLGPSMDQTGLDQAGYFPRLPTLTAKGKVDPFDQPQQAAQLNLLQDIWGSYDDPMLGAMSGAGGFGPEAFQPTYDYGEPLNLTGRKTAQQYLDRGGYRGYIADAIMNQGMGPDEAAASAMDLAMNTDITKVTDPKQKALIESLQKTLPQFIPSGNAATPPSGQQAKNAADLPGGRKAVTQYNVKEVGDFATSLFEGIAKDPTFSYQDEATGNFYAKTPEQAMQKTEAMKAFDKAGIPYMTDQYTDQGYIDKAIGAATGRDAQGQQAAEQDFTDQMTKLMGERELSTGRQKQAAQTMDEMRRATAAGKFENMTPEQIYGIKPKANAGTMPMHTLQMGPFSVMAPTPLDFSQGVNAGATEPSFTPPQASVYVDKDGNIVQGPSAPPLRPLRDYTREGSPTKRPAQAGDMAQLQKQYNQENQANLDYYRQRDQLQQNDPNRERGKAILRAQLLSQAGRTPTRDALMQRQMALRAMGFGQ